MKFLILLFSSFLFMSCGDAFELETRESEIDGPYIETLCNSTGYRVVLAVDNGVFFRPPLEEGVCQAPLRCVPGIGNRPCQ